jgi:hypothetical protein
MQTSFLDTHDPDRPLDEATTWAEPPRLVGGVVSNLLIFAIEGALPSVPQQE